MYNLYSSYMVISVFEIDLCFTGPQSDNWYLRECGGLELWAQTYWILIFDTPEGPSGGPNIFCI